MHPIELIALMMAVGILLIILFISFMTKGKWRKIMLSFAVLYIVLVVIFYFVRPYWIDMQIDKKIDYLIVHLEGQYPGETWEFETVPHRENGYEHMNPYHISVIFDTEIEVEYQYFVSDKETIKQSGYSTPNGYQSELLHLEEN